MKHPRVLETVCGWRGQRLWRFLAAVALIAVVIRLTVPCSSLQHSRQPRTVVLYSFSIMREAMEDGIIPMFCEHWKETTGESVEFISTFAGSGLITNRIIRRIQPEIAILASKLDVLRLREHGMFMIPSQDLLPHGGVVSRSPMVIVVRSGNPLSITTFEHLTQEGTKVVLADPRTSGGAQWALMAAYSEFLTSGHGRTEATEKLLVLWKNVTLLPQDARRAREVFAGGVGDALITYEAEALRHLQRPDIVDEIIYPKTPLISEHMVMVINKNIAAEQRELVKAFLDFLWSDHAQMLLVHYGLRSIDERFNAENTLFHPLGQCHVLDDLGGAAKAREHIIHRIVALMSRDAGPGMRMGSHVPLDRYG